MKDPLNMTKAELLIYVRQLLGMVRNLQNQLKKHEN
jgi:hypothetical protein